MIKSWADMVDEVFGFKPSKQSKEDDLAFLRWAEKTHPAYLNNLKQAYKKYKEDME